MIQVHGTQANLRDQRDALDKLEGMPKPPGKVGDAVKNLVPKFFTKGGSNFGWTEHSCDLSEDIDTTTLQPKGTFTLMVPEDVANRHHGKTVQLDDGRSVVVDVKPVQPSNPTLIEQVIDGATNTVEGVTEVVKKLL